MAYAWEAAPLRIILHGLTHRNMLRARDSKLPTMRTMHLWRQKVTHHVYPPLPRIICWGEEEDPAHMRSLGERGPDVAAALSASVEELVDTLPLGDQAAEF